jgi:hypothetical protein
MSVTGDDRPFVYDFYAFTNKTIEVRTNRLGKHRKDY